MRKCLQQLSYFFISLLSRLKREKNVLIQDALHQQTLHVTHIDIQLLKHKAQTHPHVCFKEIQQHTADSKYCVQCVAKSVGTVYHASS